MFELRSYQRECVESIRRYIESKDTRPGIVIAPVGCHGKDSMIPLFDATLKKVQDIEIGDRLIGDDGTPRIVLQLVRGIDDLYEITPLKGHSFIVNKGHILSLYRTPDGKTIRTSMPGIDEISVEDYISASKNFKRNHKLRKGNGAFFDNKENLPLPPYFMGLYLGDGHFGSSVNITTRWKEVAEYLYGMVKNYDSHIREYGKKEDSVAKSYFITTGKGPGLKTKRNEIARLLENMGLRYKKAEDKFIPIEYLRATWEDRMQLLAGLIDTDSYYDHKGNIIEYCSKSYTMIKQVQFLCRSLGFGAEIGKTKVVNGRNYYRININGDLNLIPNRVLKRKGLPRNCKKRNYVMSFDIKYIGKGEFYGFVLDGNHLYCDDQFFVHHNCGKSIMIAETAKLLGDKVLVLQPSKELLEQNIEKLRAIGGEATVFSASCKSKVLSGMTYATIGSVKKVVGELRSMGIRNLLLDECHAGFSPEPDSEFMRFVTALKPSKIIGFTATPCRLSSVAIDRENHAVLKFLTRMRPGFFKSVIHTVQVSDMLREGFWSPLSTERWIFDGSKLTLNSNGSEYTEESVREAVEQNGVNNLILKRIMMLENRKSILVFMDSVENCNTAADWINKKGNLGKAASVHGGLSKRQRDVIVEGFKSGDIRIVFNHSVLLTGFDHPELDAVIFGRPTFSFPVFYQSIGRGLRISPKKKDCLFIDCCDNSSRFGDIRSMEIKDIAGFGWGIVVGDRVITNFPMEDTVMVDDIERMKVESKLPPAERRKPGRPDIPEGEYRINFGMYKGYKLKALPNSYLSFLKEKGMAERNKNINDYVNLIRI